MKAKNTENLLIDALKKLAAGVSIKSNGKITQENIALEAGVSRATLNRYPRVIAEYRKIKKRGGPSEVAKPLSLFGKNRELKDANTELEKRAVQEKKNAHKNLAAARQEIFILNRALQMRDEIAAIKDRELAELKRKLFQRRRS